MNRNSLYTHPCRILTIVAVWPICVLAQTVTFCGGQGESFGESGSANVLLATPDVGGAVTVSVAVDLILHHEWVGDVTAFLTHGGVTIALMDRPAFPLFPYGCGGDDVVAAFRDEAASTIGNTCSVLPPSIGGVFKPNQPLSSFAATDAGGLWALTLIDWGADDCGMLPAGGICIHLTYAADCNANQIPDDQDIAADPGADLDGNSLLDECQLPGDANADGVVDLDDFMLFEQCTSEGSFEQSCWAFDFDMDEDVDLIDFRAFQMAFTG